MKEIVKKYAVIDKDNRVLKTYSNQAPATAWARACSRTRDLTVIELTYEFVASAPVRKCIGGVAFKCS